MVTVTVMRDGRWRIERSTLGSVYLWLEPEQVAELRAGLDNPQYELPPEEED